MFALNWRSHSLCNFLVRDTVPERALFRFTYLRQHRSTVDCRLWVCAKTIGNYIGNAMKGIKLYQTEVNIWVTRLYLMFKIVLAYLSEGILAHQLAHAFTYLTP